MPYDTQLDFLMNPLKEVETGPETGKLVQHTPFKLSDSFLDHFRGKQPNWGPLGYVTYKRTYARALPDGSYEEFWQTLQRVVEGAYRVQQKHCQTLKLPWNAVKAQRSAQEMFNRFWAFKCMPPGRGLWMMGTEYVERVGSGALNNCSFVSTVDIKSNFAAPFCFLMDMSMLGSGVTFDTEGAGTVTIQRPFESSTRFHVQDSREGWVALIRAILDAYVRESELPVKIDYRKVRPSGAPIKGFGGTASGPGPLKLLVKDIQKILNARIGQKITSTDIVDLFNLIARCVVSGNVRRSATEGLGKPDDKEFQELKDPDKYPEQLKSHRWASNNSLLVKIGMDYTKVAAQSAKNGEPGFVWLKTAQDYSRLCDVPDYKDEAVRGTNPCFVGSTRVPTDRGLLTASELVGQKDLLIASDGMFLGKVRGTAMVATDDGVFLTRRNADVLRVITAEGPELLLTPDHQIWSDKGKGFAYHSASSLISGDRLAHQVGAAEWVGEGCEQALLLGYSVGDGWRGRNSVGWSVSKDEPEVRDWLNGELAHLGVKSLVEKPTEWWQQSISSKVKSVYDSWGYSVAPAHLKTLPKSVWSMNRLSACNFLRGLFSADGHVEWYEKHTSCSVRLTSASRQLLLDVQLLLLNLGIMSRVYSGHSEGLKFMPDGRGGEKEYLCLKNWRLVITGQYLKQFSDEIGFIVKQKEEKLHSWLTASRRGRGFYKKASNLTVVAVETAPPEDVYDVRVPVAHALVANGMLIHNCGEMSLESFEMCNLVECYPAHHATYEDFQKTLKYAYLYAKTVTLIPTHDARTNAVMLRNRRIGTSLSGIVQACARHGRRNFFEWCKKGYEYLCRLDKMYSSWLCVPESKKKTTVKPSGTVSLLAGATPGVHFPESEYYIRNIRMEKGSKIPLIMENAGYMTEDDLTTPNTTVVSIPVHELQFDRGKADVSMWEQLELVAQLQQFWSDNQVSATISFKPEEAKDIKHALELYEVRLKGITFNPLYGPTPQAPYIPISKERFEELSAKLKPFDLSQVSHEVTERFCDGASCEVRPVLMPIPANNSNSIPPPSPVLLS